MCYWDHLSTIQSICLLKDCEKSIFLNYESFSNIGPVYADFLD